MPKINLHNSKRESTKRALIDAAFAQLTAEKNFSNLSLREVTREARLSPSSFYYHFQDMNELGIVMVDEAGLTLRQLMRQARKRITRGGNIIVISVHVFFEFIQKRPAVFRLLLRENSGISQEFRSAVLREIKHFTEELAEYIADHGLYTRSFAYEVADGMVTLVFAAGANALDMHYDEWAKLQRRIICQLFMLSKGANALAHLNKRYMLD